MEQAIRAELWKVLDASDLESVTSKEVGRGPGDRVPSSRGRKLAFPGSPPHLACLQS